LTIEAFGKALLRTMLAGDVNTGKALRDYIKATVGFEKLGEATDTQGKGAGVGVYVGGMAILMDGMLAGPWPRVAAARIPPAPRQPGHRRDVCTNTTPRIPR
jgi:hypothetical protein